MVLVFSVNVVVLDAPLKYVSAVPVALVGVKITLGADAKALANVTVASMPVAAQPVPVVTLMSPAVSLPVTVITVGVQAAAPDAIVVEPLVLEDNT